MKHCPECNRNYADTTLSFCLNDGAPLIFGSAEDEPPTAILHETDASTGASTRAQIQTTALSGESPMISSGDSPRSRAINKKIFVASGVLAIVALGVFFGYRYFNSAGSAQIKFDDAITVCEHALKLDPYNQRMLEQAGIAYVRSGHRDKAEDILKRFDELQKTRFVGPSRVAALHVALENRD